MLKIKKKIIIIGSYMVGKTAILNKFIHHKFIHDYKSTMGVNIMSKEYMYEEFNTELTFLIWDIGGQNLFQSMWKRFYNKAEAAIIVFDITRRNTFDAIKDWYSSILINLGQKVPIVLIGNKKDLVEKRIVKTPEGKSLSDELRIEFLETSAKTGENIDLIFNNIGKKLLMSIETIQENIK